MTIHSIARTSLWVIVPLLFNGQLANADAGVANDDNAALQSSVDFDWPVFILPPPAGADSRSTSDFDFLESALANESFSEAEILAKRMVEQAIAGGIDSGARARALHNLAVTQQTLGKHDSAKQNFVAAVDVISVDQDNLSSDLILPLRGLASALLATEQAGEAFSVLDRALHISNVNYGPHNLEQLPMLDSKIDFHLEHGDSESALDVLEHVYVLYTRRYSRLSAELLPAHYQRANVFSQLKNYNEERRAWRHILAIKQAHHAADDVELIEPKIRLAANIVRSMRTNSFRSVSSSDAEKHLKSALRIARNSPEGDWKVRMDCLLSLADFYTLFDMKARARRYYSEAWDLLSADESLATTRRENLESPVVISQRPPDPYANFEYRSDRDNSRQEDYLEGEMTLKFTVDDRGRPRDVRIVAAEPPEFSHMERRVLNAAKQFVYRPRLVDGVPADTGDHQYRARYYYRPSDYRASVEKTEARKRTRSGKDTER